MSAEDEEEDRVQELVSYSENGNEFPVVAGILLAGLVFFLIGGCFMISMTGRSSGSGVVAGVHSPAISFSAGSSFEAYETHQALRHYYSAHAAFPTTEQGLEALIAEPVAEPVPRPWEPCLTTLPVDNAGLYFRYEAPASKKGVASGSGSASTTHHYRIWSLGPDGTEGTGDDRITYGPEIERSVEGDVLFPYLGGKHSLAEAAEALDAYYKLVGKFPRPSEGLEALVSKPESARTQWRQILREVPTDPYGNPLRYSTSSAGWELFSDGPDGVRGNHDDEQFDFDMWKYQLNDMRRP